jgi:hypothetical protein
MANTFYRNVCSKIKEDMPREEKEQIMYDALIKTDRIFTRNCREGNLFNDFGSEVSLKFIRQIKDEEKEIGRRLNAIEIENLYQKMLEGLEGLKNGNCNNRLY